MSAGVGNVAIMDDDKVEQEDLGCQFFLGEDDVGKRTRAEASVAGLQVLFLPAGGALLARAPLLCAPACWPGDRAGGPKTCLLVATAGAQSPGQRDSVQGFRGRPGRGRVFLLRALLSQNMLA